MFGYVKPFQPELKIREYETYRGVYCGLCRRLGRSFGPFARLALSFDITFLALLRLALLPEEPTFQPGRCVANPLRKCKFCQCAQADTFDTDLTIILLYYKAADQIADARFWGRLGGRLLRHFLAPAHRKAARRSPQLEALAVRMMEAQQAAESAGAGLDAAAEPSAAFLSAVCAGFAQDETRRRVLARFGYLLGRYVYLTDALEDLEKDARRGAFNPLLSAGGAPDALALASTNATLAELYLSLQLLQPVRYEAILQNIIEYGLRQSVQMIQQRKDRKKHG